MHNVTSAKLQHERGLSISTQGDLKGRAVFTVVCGGHLQLFRFSPIFAGRDDKMKYGPFLECVYDGCVMFEF
jgi:hypothetical protein